MKPGSPDTLDEWLRHIGTEHPRGVLRGLAGVREVAQRLDVLPPASSTIVVAGTNGKGSTTLFAEQLLLAAGHRVGATVSPHVHRFNERIRVDGRAVSDTSVVLAFKVVEQHRGEIELSYFEYAILAALVAIRAAEVDVAVLEVGLGGRLDAVNAVDADVAVITSIALDHQAYLGDDREQIGREKAGVLRPRRPVAIGDLEPPASVLERAAELAAPVYRVGEAFGCDENGLWLAAGDGRRTFRYVGDNIAPVNAATALAAASQIDPALEQAHVDQAAGTANPGRFEVVDHAGKTWVLDVAHNPAAAEFLAQQLRQRFPGRRMAAIVGCLNDKDVAGVVAPLRPLIRAVSYVDTLPPRGQSAAASREAAGDPRAFAGNLPEALARAARQPSNGVILLLGSFDVVERARQWLGLAAGER